MNHLERLRRGLPQRISQEAMARAVGCSLQHYNRIERGVATPDPELCVRLADVLIGHGARIDRAHFVRHYHPQVARAFLDSRRSAVAS